MKDLSVIIPARNEEFLGETARNILQNFRGNSELIVILDGYDTEIPELPNDPRLVVLKFNESIGQRAATNQAVRLSQAKYIAKTDAHCSFDEGFDVKLMDKMQDDYTMVPIMYNLHAFDWVCQDCGNRRYQGPEKPCEKCGGVERKEVVWFAKPNPESTSYRFDNTLHFQYFGQFKKRPEYEEQKAKDNLTDTMGLQGSFWLLTRDKYWELNICDEKHGSWGQQGVEVACKTWLSGGRVVCNHDTWYAHMFRTQQGFSFPYEQKGSQIQQAREYSKKLFVDGGFKGKHDLQWLLDKFYPVPGWALSKGILYYSAKGKDPELLEKVQKQLYEQKREYRIVSCTLGPMDFGDNISLDMEPGPEAYYTQILTGLKELDTDVVFLCEDDVLYHPSHFDFDPPKSDTFYYNTNVWRVRYEDGHAVRTDDCRQVSGLCGYRSLLLEHYRRRLDYVRQHGQSAKLGWEPGTHNRVPELSEKSERWESEWPNIDIRTGDAITKSKWKPEDYRNEKFAEGWQETDNIPGWGSFTHLWNRIPKQ